MKILAVFVASVLLPTSVVLASPQRRPAAAATPAPTPNVRLQQRLMHSVMQDEIDQVSSLLKSGGDPNARTSFGPADKWFLDNRRGDDPAPPLIVLACRFQSIQGSTIIKMLLDKGADVNIADKNGITPLMAASELGGAVPLLLERKAKVNPADKDGNTALMHAMGNFGIATASSLLQQGANINARNKQGETALMLAIVKARNDPYRLFGEDLAKKAEAAKSRYIELIQFLIDSHADVNVHDNLQNTPLKLAVDRKEIEVAAMLRKAGAKL